MTTLNSTPHQRSLADVGQPPARYFWGTLDAAPQSGMWPALLVNYHSPQTMCRGSLYLSRPYTWLSAYRHKIDTYSYLTTYSSSPNRGRWTQFCVEWNNEDTSAFQILWVRPIPFLRSSIISYQLSAVLITDIDISNQTHRVKCVSLLEYIKGRQKI